jgi:hypothetical protein
MQMNNVQSSQFKRVGYDATTQKMRIDFGKSTYEYSNVSGEDYAQFMGADSLGRHFGATFKKNDKFPFQRLSTEEHDASQPKEQQA